MKILIAYGTLTGNSETVAKHLFDLLSQTLQIELQIKDQADTAITELSNFDLVVLVGSTWGEGEANPITEDFMQRLEAELNENIATKFALLGLGDSSYEFFCGVIDQLDRLLTSKNVNIIHPNLKLDGLPEGENIERVNEWIDGVLAQLK